MESGEARLDRSNDRRSTGMTVVAAFLVPGSPLPLLKPSNPPWGQIAEGYRRAARSLAAAKPDVLLIYSTQWIAVLDQLWQTRPHVAGTHVDENWYEYGDLPYDIRVDAELANACITSTATIGVRSRAVNYDAFPIDTGSIVACHFLLKGDPRLVVLTSNNLYHDAATTERLAKQAVGAAEAQGKRVAVIGVGNLSGTNFRKEIDISQDRIASTEDDRWNKRILNLLEHGDVGALAAEAPVYAREARVDMGFKHFHWILGATGGQIKGATIHAYGPVYGAGAAVVECRI
jgi:2-aminophenol/2-amino-5-chlorophenol 1,6-dioxygenase alpha subunit